MIFLCGTLVVGNLKIFYSWGNSLSSKCSKKIIISIPSLSWLTLLCMPDHLKPKVTAFASRFHSLLFFHSCFLERNKGISPIFNRLLGNVNPAESRRCITDGSRNTPRGPSATTLPNPTGQGIYTAPPSLSDKTPCKVPHRV